MLQFFKKESDNMVINLPAYIKEILNILNQKGEAFVVGGCVRDYLLGLTPHDWDITTDRLPEEVKEKLDIVPVKKVTDVLKDQALM